MSQTVAPIEGLERCITCSTGEYQDGYNGTACTPCQEGHWCTRDAQIACSENTYNSHPRASHQTNCTRCPERTTTLALSARTSIKECSCSEGFYFAPENHTQDRNEQCTARCCTCPVGTTCETGSISLAMLPLERGYFRLTRDSVDVRRCPDAAANCSSRNSCPSSSSGCRGGNNETCMPGLDGTFCRNCEEDFHFYVRASTDETAHCAPCSEVSSSRSFAIITVFLSGVAAATVLALLSKQLPAYAKRRLGEVWHATTEIYHLCAFRPPRTPKVQTPRIAHSR